MRGICILSKYCANIYFANSFQYIVHKHILILYIDHSVWNCFIYTLYTAKRYDKSPIIVSYLR